MSVSGSDGDIDLDSPDANVNGCQGPVFGLTVTLTLTVLMQFDERSSPVVPMSLFRYWWETMKIYLQRII